MKQFIHAATDLPPLVKIALVHVQFETIHPYLDGNGRIGRLLIAALLEHFGLLPERLMYLRGQLKALPSLILSALVEFTHRRRFGRLGNLFLESVADAASDAERGVLELASLITADRRRLLDSPKAGPASYRRFEMLPMMPRFTVEQVRKKLATSFPGANATVKVLGGLGLAVELTGQKKTTATAISHV